MHIIHMLIVVTVVFMIALFLMCLFRRKLYHPVFNPLFVGSAALLILAWNYAMYEHNGLKNGLIIMENISPYICTVIAVTPLLNQKVKDYAYSAIAFLGFGMFLAMFISPEFEYLFNYEQEAELVHVSEAACHVLMGIYGFYLILSDRVTLTLRSFAKAAIFMYASIGFGVFLNLILHRSFFGMNMYGRYSIYFLDIFGSFEITLIAYLVGVLGTLALGFLVGSLLDRLSRARKVHEDPLP